MLVPLEAGRKHPIRIWSYRNLGDIQQECWTGQAGPLQDYYVFLLAGPFLQILIKIS